MPGKGLTPARQSREICECNTELRPEELEGGMHEKL